MNFDPTLLEALVGALLAALGVGTGVGVRRSKKPPGEDEQLAALRAQLAELGKQLGELATTLERAEALSASRERARKRLAGDLDAVSDALDILVTHIGDQLPEQARRSMSAKLERRQRHEVSGVQPASKS